MNKSDKPLTKEGQMNNPTEQEQEYADYEAYKADQKQEYELYKASQKQYYELYKDRAGRKQAYIAELEKIQNGIKWATVVVVVWMIAVNLLFR